MSNSYGFNSDDSPNKTASHLQLPSPIITRRTRTASTSERALGNPQESGKIKSFCRNKGHGFIAPEGGGGDIFVHISEKEEGDELSVQWLHRIYPIPLEAERPIHSTEANTMAAKEEERELVELMDQVRLLIHENVALRNIEGEYVPLPGDEVTFRLCPIPPKFEKHQAVHVAIVHFTPEKHVKWDEPPL